jgi:hypothetical protein
MSPNLAFTIAIENGLLSSNPNDHNYAGLYMYMGVQHQGTDKEVLLFKNINTREYIKF